MKNNVQTSQFKFVYFDLGGVLFTFNDGLRRLATKHSIRYEAFEEVFKKYDNKVCRGEISSQELWKLYQNELKFTDNEITNFADYWVSNFVSIPQTKKLIKDLAGKTKIGLITNRLVAK
ncbi:MAG: hypothetical protein COY80_04880 [Candidatus Pacebacteria bacterium CG_4_10_14_0_8_um_filter_42_14]|nr:MAG: hypothetical protein COY80_04880 [Candidatus Pacebacteria bacterium CG_4_10_14_0_8_um_filter_42_14]